MLFVSIPVFASRAKLFIAAWWFHLCYVLAAHSEQFHWECFLVCVSKCTQHAREKLCRNWREKKAAGTSIHPHVINLQKAEMIEVGK